MRERDYRRLQYLGPEVGCWQLNCFSAFNFWKNLPCIPPVFSNNACCCLFQLLISPSSPHLSLSSSVSLFLSVLPSSHLSLAVSLSLPVFTLYGPLYNFIQVSWMPNLFYLALYVSVSPLSLCLCIYFTLCLYVFVCLCLSLSPPTPSHYHSKCVPFPPLPLPPHLQPLSLPNTLM